MKKSYFIIMILFISILCAGCSEESKYDKAVEHYNNGKFTEDNEKFAELDNYEDSDTYIRKCEVMKRLQGTYVDTDNGDVEFTINKFDVLNWDEGTTIELDSSCKTVTFEKLDSEDTEWKLNFRDSKPVLEHEAKLVLHSYTRL